MLTSLPDFKYSGRPSLSHQHMTFTATDVIVHIFDFHFFHGLWGPAFPSEFMGTILFLSLPGLGTNVLWYGF